MSVGQQAKNTIQIWNGAHQVNAKVLVLGEPDLQTISGPVKFDTVPVGPDGNPFGGGGDFQPHDAELDALASTTSAANKLPYFTGSGTATVTDLSSFGRSLIDDADAAAARTTLGIDLSLYLPLTGGTLSGNLVLANDPSSALHPATKQYVDTLVTGIKPKGSVRVATTANITLSGTQTIDSIAVIANDTVLVKNQSTASQNGLYVVAAGAWSRDSRLDVWAEVPGATVVVEEGTTNADTGWISTANSGGTIGSTSMPWTQWFGTGLYQTHDSELDALAGLTSAADRLPYFTGSGTAALATFTAAARALLDDADATTMLTTLGLSTFFKTLVDDAAATDVLNTLLFNQNETPVNSLRSAGDITTVTGDVIAPFGFGQFGNLSLFAISINIDRVIGPHEAIIRVDLTGGNKNLTFHRNPRDGEMHIIQKIDNTSNQLTLTGNIDNNGSVGNFTSTTGRLWLELRYDGESGNWQIIRRGTN